MGFLSELFKRFKPVEVDDAFFGRLVYIKRSNGRSYWEGRHRFSPCRQEIGVFIDAPGHRQAPDQKQREFFSWVERDYEAIIASVGRVLRPQYEQWTRKPFAKPFKSEFKLTSFDIPLQTGDPMEWEMCFDSETDANHLFSVTLQGAEAICVSIDG